MAKLTKNQALDKLEKAVEKVAEAGMKRIDGFLPKLKASAKKLADQLKANESPELIDTQSKHLKLQMRGVAIGGKNPANTLLAHLSRDERFYRPSRGTYALREWNPKAKSVGVRRKKGA